MTENKPIGEVLNGLQIKPLDEGDMPIDALVVVRTMDRDGRMAWTTRHTDNLSAMETFGILTAELARNLKDYTEGWQPDDA